MRPGARRFVWFALAAALAFALPAAAKTTITFLHTPPGATQPNTPIVVSGNVFGAAEMEHATLVFRIGNGAWKRLDLSREGADTYTATIPASDVVQGVLAYYVEGVDYFGDTQSIFANPQQPQLVTVGRGGPVPSSNPAKAQANPPPEKPAKVEPEAEPAPVPVAQKSRIEKWDPDADATKAELPAPEKPAPAKPKDALADSLSMFGAEDTISLASRHEQSVSDAAAIVSVVTQEQIRALDLRTLADLAKVLPGFETSRDVQGFWRVATRGRRVDPELLVLYDGHRLNSAYDGRVMWELPLDDVERVEVIRGPGGALYGAGAFSGVINVIPRRDTGVSGRVGFGSFGDVEGALRGGRTMEKLSIFGSLDVATRAGYARAIDHDALTTSPDVTAGDTDDRRTGYGGHLRAEYAFNDQASAFGGVRLLREDRGALVGLIDVVGPGSDLSWTQLLADAGVQGTLAGWAFKGRLYADAHWTDRLFLLFPAGYTKGRVVFDDGVKQQTLVTMTSLGAETSASKSLGTANALTVGLQLERQKLSNFQYLANVNGEEPTESKALVEQSGVTYPQKEDAYSGRVVLGLFAQDEWKLADPLRLTAGLRADYVSGFGLNFNPRLGLVWRPTPQFALKALFARAFRAPTFEEFTALVVMPPSLNSGQVQGFSETDPLKPVTVTNVELGGEAVTTLDGHRATIRANAFANWFANPIEPVDATGAPQLQNRPGVRVVGAEGEGRYEFSRLGSTFLNVSWMRAVDLAVEETTPAFSLLTDVPQLRANWGMTLPVGSVASFTVLAQFGSERRNDARTQLEATRRFRIPAYGLVSVSLRSRPILEHYEVALGIVNVTDLDYRDDVPRPDGPRMPGLLPREGVHGMLTLRASY